MIPTTNPYLNVSSADSTVSVSISSCLALTRLAKCSRIAKLVDVIFAWPVRSSKFDGRILEEISNYGMDIRMQRETTMLENLWESKKEREIGLRSDFCADFVIIRIEQILNHEEKGTCRGRKKLVKRGYKPIVSFSTLITSSSLDYSIFLMSLSYIRVILWYLCTQNLMMNAFLLELGHRA